MKHTIIKGLWIVALLVAIYVFFVQNVFKHSLVQSPSIASIENKPQVEVVQKDIIIPAPLHASSTVALHRTVATGFRIVALTNQERQKAALPTLGENTLLDSAAIAKVRDMFAKQYFEHKSLTGEDVSFWIKNEGYDFLIVGENLAMGGFKDDQAIVDAWMASPGHRENILNTKYREIGVAAASGIFDGKKTTLAVQVFAMPSSVCPKPDSTLKETIDTKTSALDAMQKQLDVSREDIPAYNSLVTQYNAMIAEIKNLINDYNGQVNRVNACIRAVQ